MYLAHTDKFIHLLLSNVKKVVFKAIKVAVVELVLVKSYVSYANNSVKLKVLDVIDIYRVVTY